MKVEGQKLTRENRNRLESLHELQKLDEFKPNIHLMPYSGLLNDPNGLCFINGRYHIFYQWSPFSANHGLKHWGHYSTEDFVNFIHHDVAIIPTISEENAGAYSGSSIVVDDEAHIFYSGNIVKREEKKIMDCATILVRMDKHGNVSKEKKVLFTIDKTRYTKDFRDPYIFERDSIYYLMFGAQLKDKSAVLTLYKSDIIDRDYQLVGEIKFSNLERLGKMVECPSYFNLDRYEILMFSPNKMDPYIEADEKPIFVLGYFIAGEDCLFHDITRYQFVDHGFEFYAPQILNKGDRRIIIGWLGQVRQSPYPNLKYQWANTLTLPREVTAKERWVYQNPIKELQELRKKEVNCKEGIYKINNQKKSYELLLKNTRKKAFRISLTNSQGKDIVIQFYRKKFYVWRNNMSLPYYPEFGERRDIKGIEIRDIRIYFDVSVFEIFINKGQYTMTGRYFIKNANKIKVETSGEVTLYELKNIQIKYEDILSK